jgi:hypothetical protein
MQLRNQSVFSGDVYGSGEQVKLLLVSGSYDSRYVLTSSLAVDVNGGIYHVYPSEVITIYAGRMIDAYHETILDGRLINNGILITTPQ